MVLYQMAKFCGENILPVEFWHTQGKNVSIICPGYEKGSFWMKSVLLSVAQHYSLIYNIRLFRPSQRLWEASLSSTAFSEIQFPGRVERY